MLVLGRKLGEQIWVSDQVRITVVKLDNQSVRLGIEAPAHIKVDRAEVRKAQAAARQARTRRAA
jgi:carbon storage regulator